jgi:hypothetical protein
MNRAFARLHGATLAAGVQGTGTENSCPAGRLALWLRSGRRVVTCRRDSERRYDEVDSGAARDTL